MKEALTFRIFGVVLLIFGIFILMTGVFVFFNSFSGLTGLVISEEVNKSATNLVGVLFIVVGLIIVVTWGSHFLSNEK